MNGLLIGIFWPPFAILSRYSQWLRKIESKASTVGKQTFGTSRNFFNSTGIFHRKFIRFGVNLKPGYGWIRVDHGQQKPK
jgi:hypothetical protein